MNGIYVHFNKDHLNTKYIDYYILNVDLRSSFVEFYSIEGELILKEENISLINGKVICEKVNLILELDDEGNLRLSINRDGDQGFPSFSYLFIDKPVKELNIESPCYLNKIKRVGGYLFFKFENSIDKTRSHLFPITEIEKNSLKYFNLIRLKDESFKCE